MTQLDLGQIAQFLPTGAFDVTLRNPFVATWKAPNKYAESGFTSDNRFFALPFLQALQAQIPSLKNWEIQNYEHAPADLWADRAKLQNGNLVIWASVKGYGAGAFEKVDISAYALSSDRRKSSAAIEASCSLSRPIEQIAKDISKRILRDLDATQIEQIAKDKAKAQAEKKLTDKGASLAKSFQNLRIRVDIEAQRIRIESKYGSAIRLDAYAYLDSQKGIWRLTSERGSALSVADIDGKAGRAFLKLCDKESF
jgi:hypothetical protein